MCLKWISKRDDESWGIDLLSQFFIIFFVYFILFWVQAHWPLCKKKILRSSTECYQLNTNFRYENWKANLDILYARILSQPLEWPSLTFQFMKYRSYICRRACLLAAFTLPFTISVFFSPPLFLNQVSVLSLFRSDQPSDEIKFLVGTHTDGEQNYLIVGSCNLGDERSISFIIICLLIHYSLFIFFLFLLLFLLLLLLVI